MTKLTDIFEQTTTFMTVCYDLALNTRLFRRAMQLRRNSAKNLLYYNYILDSAH